MSPGALVSDAITWIRAIRNSHERFSGLVSPLDGQAAQAPSYDDEWSIAQVASHLGSQAEIFALFLQAGLENRPAPGPDEFTPIWDRWNALTPSEQITGSVRTNEEFVRTLESLSGPQREQFALTAFGMELDLTGLARMRLGEHALHTWDIAVAIDPAATVAGDAVELLIDTLPDLAARVGKAQQGGSDVVVETSEPARLFLLQTGPDVVLKPLDSDSAGASRLRLPAESLVRLVYGRLDPAHTPSRLGQQDALAQIRPVFTGF